MTNPAPNPKGKAEDWTNPSLEKAKNAGSQAMDKARDTAASVGELASQAAAATGKKADDLTASAGTGLRKLADTIGDNAPREGALGTASQAVAKTLKQSGKYLQEAKLSGMAEDVTELIRRNPFPAILLGLGVGFLLGRTMRS